MKKKITKILIPKKIRKSKKQFSQRSFQNLTTCGNNENKYSQPINNNNKSQVYSIYSILQFKLRFLRDLKGQKVHKRDRKRQVYIHSALRLRSKYKAKRGGGSAQRGNQGTQPVSVVHKSSTLDPTCLHPPAHPRRSPPVLWLFLGPVARTSARRQAEI